MKSLSGCYFTCANTIGVELPITSVTADSKISTISVCIDIYEYSKLTKYSYKKAMRVMRNLKCRSKRNRLRKGRNCVDIRLRNIGDILFN